MPEKYLFLAMLLVSLTVPRRTPAEEPLASEPGRSLNVLLYFGLYTQWYRIEEALKPLPESSLRIVNARSDGADFLPSEEEIAAFDVVVLSDVNHGSIREAGLTVIASFVRRGGGLLVLGGPFTYGQGKYEDSSLPDLLPIQKPGRFDLKWEKAGLPLAEATTHGILKGLDFSARPHVFWIHEGSPKRESTVVLKAGDRPLLVLGQPGQGRVAAFLGTPLGTVPEGLLPFWEWKDWPLLLRNTLGWLAEDP